jgi:hypothetical protein
MPQSFISRHRPPVVEGEEHLADADVYLSRLARLAERSLIRPRRRPERSS